MIQANELIGRKIKMLTVINRMPNHISKSGKSSIIVECRCECGTVKTFYLSNITKGKTVSCGCLAKKKAAARATKHGLTWHPLYKVLHGLKRRCLDERDVHFKKYGARGVKVCQEWIESFTAFYDWAISNGWAKGLHIDKDIKGDGYLYSPETCCFVTPAENNKHKRNNRLVTFEGITKPVIEWAEQTGIDSQTLFKRLKNNWDNKDLFSPKYQRRVKPYTKPQITL